MFSNKYQSVNGTHMCKELLDFWGAEKIWKAQMMYHRINTLEIYMILLSNVTALYFIFKKKESI